MDTRAAHAGGKHLADRGIAGNPYTGKLPWHPTFSKESTYSNSAHPGGEWYEDSNGKAHFRPSRSMIEHGQTRG